MVRYGAGTTTLKNVPPAMPTGLTYAGPGCAVYNRARPVYLKKHGYYWDANGATQAAWRYPELIVWEDDCCTLLLRWPEGYDFQRRLGKAQWLKAV